MALMPKPGQLLWLSRADVLAAGGGDMSQAIEAVRQALQAWRAGQAVQPAKTSLRLVDSQHEAMAGVVNVLPAAVTTSSGTFFGVKALGALPGNTTQGVPRATGTITLFDDEHKTPVAVMDAQVISAMRTGAVSALAAPLLCRPDSSVLGCIGAGVNMMTQIRGLLQALPSIREVWMYSRGESKHELVAKLSSHYPKLQFRVASTPQQAASLADVIITCVANASQPVVPMAAVNRPGVTILNIGCLENEPELLAHMDVIVSDNWQQSKHRGVQTHAVAYARGLISDEDVVNLTDILAGAVPGRGQSHQKIFFGPTGLGIEDISLAVRIYQRACQRGIGTILTAWEDESWI